MNNFPDTLLPYYIDRYINNFLILSQLRSDGTWNVALHTWKVFLYDKIFDDGYYHIFTATENTNLNL